MQHPDVFVPEIKELHFFSYDQNWRLGMEWYEAAFAGHRMEKCIGEASTSYTKNARPKLIAKRIGEALPAAKLLYVIRNPVDRMLSQYKHLLVNGLRKSFAESLAEEDLLDVSCYFEKLEPYLEYYPADRIKIFFFDNLLNNPANTVSEAFRFLDVDPSFKPENMGKAYNVSKKKISRVSKENGADLKAFLADFGTLTDETRKNVVSRLLADQEKVSRFTGQSIDIWDPETHLNQLFPV